MSFRDFVCSRLERWASPRAIYLLQSLYHTARLFAVPKIRRRWMRGVGKRPCDFQHYLSVVAIAKNEAAYMAEWIEYHILVGVTKFYIYDNESSDGLEEVLRPYIEKGIVDYKYFPGVCQQVPAYNDILEKASRETFWLAVIDLDEFIVPVAEKNIPDFLRPFERYCGVEINWVSYGSSGHKEKSDDLVIERFKDRAAPENPVGQSVKTIANPRKTAQLEVHVSPFFFMARAVDPNGKRNYLPWQNRVPLIDKVRINHYFTKSYAEFLEKRERGIACLTSGLRLLDDFEKRDFNDVKNDPIMDQYIALVKRRMLERKAGAV